MEELFCRSCINGDWGEEHPEYCPYCLVPISSMRETTIQTSS